MSLLYCLLNSEVRAEIVRKWRSYKYNKNKPKRGSAHTLPLGVHSMVTVSRMYNGGDGREVSLSSASRIVAPEDIRSVSKSLHVHKISLNSDLHLSATQGIKLNDHYHNEYVCVDAKQHTFRQNGFVFQAETTSKLNATTTNAFSKSNTEDSTSN